ncbi:MAG: hypothetical protein JXA25_15150 [Anaerolineales bacterium]|nr:hypothetical protein [Anaerolineales bacterium]
MPKKRWHVLLAVVMVASLALAACGGGTEAPAVDAEAEARIAELEAALTEAEAAAASEDEIAALQSELESLQGELGDMGKEQCSYNAYRMGWVMDWADAGNMVDTVFGATSDFQYTFWQLTNPDAAARFEDLVSQAYTETDAEVRAGLWQQAEDIIVEEVVMVLPLMAYDTTTLVHTNVSYLFPPFGAARMADWAIEGSTTMRTTVGTAVPTLDPQQSTDTTSSFIIYQLMDAPYRFNADGFIEPLAAESYDVSEDGATYTIHLRQDAKWSDGEPVVAQHFVDGIKRLLSPDMANDYAYVMFDVVDAVEYNAGEVDDISGLAVIDDYTFTVTLTGALSYFDSILAFSTFHPVRLDVIEANPDSWTQAGNFVGNGAYVLTEHNPGANLVLTKNENYWDVANVALDTIEVSIISEPATSLAAFENGELDWIGSAGFPSEDTPRLVDTEEFLVTPRPGTYYLALNTMAAPTDNVDMRKALVYAVDRRTLIDNVAEMPWRADYQGVIPVEIPGHQGYDVGFGFDVAKAQEHLAAYMAAEGIEDAGDIVVELWYNKGGANQDLLEGVEAMWEENLGIDVRTVNVEWATYLDTLEECNAIGGGGF